MASTTQSLIATLFIFCLLNQCLGARKMVSLQDQDQDPALFTYHKGPLLSGKLSVNLIWYGKFTPTQRAIISDFITSLSVSVSSPNTTPSVATWWASIAKYYHLSLSLALGNQLIDDSYSLGHSLTDKHLLQLASPSPSKPHPLNSINVVLTASDVAVEGFCSSRCGTHASNNKSPYIWVGNSETQCPGQCAWPFHQPMYGPQNPPLIAPNNEVGLDGMVINLASLLAGTVTNPFGNGYYQGPKEAPLEAASACTGVYGKGAYPGYAGKLLVDSKTGGSYNANGANGRNYLLPALFDPSTSTCSTLV